MISLDTSNRRCNTLDDFSSTMCVPNKTEEINLNVFNKITITRIKESKTLPRHVSCECKCKFDNRKLNSDQKWSNSKCWCGYKNPINDCVFKKYYIWNLGTGACKINIH